MAIAIPIWELTEYVAVLALCAIESVFRWHVVHKNISSKTIVKPNDERDYFKDVISKINWDVDDNKKNHILHGTGSRGGHDWTKFNIDPNDPKAWWKLVPLFEEALKSPDSVTAEPTVSGDMIIRFYKYFQEYEWGIGVNVFSNYPFTYQLSDAFPLK